MGVARRWTVSLALLAGIAAITLIPCLTLASGDELVRTRSGAGDRQVSDAGTIAVRLHACPEPMRPLDLDPAACPIDADAADLQIFLIGSGDQRRDLVDAAREDGGFSWHGLPFGEYVLQATAFAPGYDRYLIPGQRGLNLAPDLGYTASPNEGYLLRLDGAQPRLQLDLYVFRAYASAGALRLNARLWHCPPGVTAVPDMRDLGCDALAAPPAGFALEIAGAEVERPLQMASADMAVPSLVIRPNRDEEGIPGWDDVPGGEYRVTAVLPAGVPGYAVRSYDPGVRVHRFHDGTGYALVFLLDAEALPAPAEATLDVYLLT